jgi:hypothetical protein
MAIDGFHLPAALTKRPAFEIPDYDLRDQAIARFEKGDFVGALQRTLKYINPRVGKIDLKRAPVRWTQGTAEVEISLLTNAVPSLQVHSSLLRCPADRSNPAALRYFLKTLSNTGQLFQPRLHGDVMRLEFQEHLSLLHPQKLIEVMQKLPGIADSHDTWLQDELGTLAYDRAAIKKLGVKETSRTLSFWRTHWTEMDALLKESRRRRSIQFLDAIGRIALNHVSYVLPLYGSLRRQLTQAADVFTDRDEKPRERENELARCIRTMQDVSDEQLLACVGHLQFAVSPFAAGSADVLRSALGSVNHMHQANELRLTGRTLEAGVGLVANYLYLLAYFVWPKPVEKSLRECLTAVSGKSWRVIADQLWQRAQGIAQHLEGAGEETTPDEEFEDNASES